MKPRLITILLLIVVTPLILMACLGVYVVRNEQERVQRGIDRALRARLSDLRERVDSLVMERERELMALTGRSDRDPDSLRAAARRERLVKQFFVATAEGVLLYPLDAEEATAEEREFLLRTAPLWPSGINFTAGSEMVGSGMIDHGWHTWFWGNGVHFLFWQRQKTGEMVGIEVDRMVLLSDVVGILPSEYSVDYREANWRIKLVNAKSDTIYQWGPYQPQEADVATLTMPLLAPLGAWTLQYFLSDASLPGNASLFGMVFVLFAVGAVMVFLAVYFYRENNRSLREAEQKVSFVNQVSHELKTPLTNIRMYGELLDNAIPEDDLHLHKWSRIVIAESERLSRLIANVLSFAKSERSALKLAIQPGVVDETVASVVTSWQPVLEKLGKTIQVNAAAPGIVEYDRDALAQILGNLLSNVEKYASSGRRVIISTAQGNGVTTVILSDDGPGIPASDRERVFVPFARLSNRVSDGVTGTGIGLGISRDLARMHGGDLKIDASESGACFRLTLKTPGEYT